MNELMPAITASQLNFIAAIGTLLAPTLAFMIYFHRRYTTRKRIAAGLIEEIQQNRGWATGQKPHYEQHGIVGLSETFIYDNIPRAPTSEEERPFSGSIAPTHVRVPQYEAGDIPPSARASSTVYESTASEISRFDQELASDLVEYYHQLNYLKELNDIVHEGRELPPAAYSVLSDFLEMYVIDTIG